MSRKSPDPAGSAAEDLGGQGPERHRMPRWVKVFLIVAAAVVLAMVAIMVASGGHHGPGRHLSSAQTVPGAQLLSLTLSAR